MNDKLYFGAAILITIVAYMVISAAYPDGIFYLLGASVLAVPFFALWYFRLPLLVEARCDDEKLVVVSRSGVERAVSLDDIVLTDSISFGGDRFNDADPWFEYGMVRIRQLARPDEVLRFRLVQSGSHLGTHRALAELTKRLRRRQDGGGE